MGCICLFTKPTGSQELDAGRGTRPQGTCSLCCKCYNKIAAVERCDKRTNVFTCRVLLRQHYTSLICQTVFSARRKNRARFPTLDYTEVAAENLTANAIHRCRNVEALLRETSAPTYQCISFKATTLITNKDKMENLLYVYTHGTHRSRNIKLPNTLHPLEYRGEFE